MLNTSISRINIKGFSGEYSQKKLIIDREFMEEIVEESNNTYENYFIIFDNLFVKSSAYIDCVKLIEEELSDIINIVGGIIAAYKRWKTTLIRHQKVKNVKTDYEQGDRSYILENIEKDLHKAEEIDKMFEETLKTEVFNFYSNYPKKGGEIINKFNLLYEFIIKEENEVLSDMLDF